MEKNNYKWIVKTIPFFKLFIIVFFFSSRRRHTSLQGEWSSDVCSSDLVLKLAGNASAEAADEALQRVGLEPNRFGARLPAELSGGQRQRVALARAFAARQQVVLLEDRKSVG